MPHLILEYSANLEESIDVALTLNAMHVCALDMAVFPVAAIRTRAARRDHYLIADLAGDYGFVHLLVRIKEGRSDDEKKRIGTGFFDALSGCLAEFQASHPLALTVEVEEICSSLSFAKNSIPKFM